MQKSFLEIVVEDIHKRYGNAIGELAIIVPNRRSEVFLKDAFRNTYQEAIWLPIISSIQDFVRSVSHRQFPETLRLVFELYQTYYQLMKEGDPDWHESFEQFYTWGELLLKDFDEVDKYLVDADQLFTNVKDLREIEALFTEPEVIRQYVRLFWSSIHQEQDQGTDLQDTFLKIWDILKELYHRYAERLSQKGYAYDGQAYRILADNLAEDPLHILPYENILFVGFNALSLSEYKIIDSLLREKRACIYWDVDRSYFSDSPKGKAPMAVPGKFIQAYHQQWKELDSFPIITDMLNSGEKHIHIRGIPLQVSQASYLGSILDSEEFEEEEFRKHAIVLGDEQLLFPVLHALPEEVKSLNITMGFPIKFSLTGQLWLAIIQLLRNSKLENGETIIGYSEVLSLLQNPFLKGYLETQEKSKKWLRSFVSAIHKQNKLVLSEQEFQTDDTPELIQLICTVPKSYEKAEEYVEEVFSALLDDMQSRKLNLEAEYCYKLLLIWRELSDLLKEYEPDLSLVAFCRMLRESFQTARIPFEGEPLKGMQVMGFLETRTLDFETLYVLGVNEGKLPNSSTSYSFIPYNLKKGFQLPTYEERDAIFAYHFFRLLGRASTVYLIYNTSVNEGGNSGEKSRFIRQIFHYFRDNDHIHLDEQEVSFPPHFATIPPIHIPHTDAVKEKLMAKYGPAGNRSLSATAFTTYIQCPLQFYFKYIAEIKEPDVLEESMEANTFGSALHDAMDMLLEPICASGREVKPENLEGLKKQIPRTVNQALGKLGISPRDLQKGNNYLFHKTIQQLCEKILQIDIDELTSKPETAAYQIHALEQEHNQAVAISTSMGDIKVNGTYDRVDMLIHDGTYRILDYKTGRATLNERKALESEFRDGKYKEVFQGYLYALLYKKLNPTHDVKVGFYLLRDIKKGVSYLNNGQYLPPEILQTFENYLIAITEDIFSKDFTQSKDGDGCKYCPYGSLCGGGG
ncbi:MAG: PD-(D/E)XK nuclease family protein [Bacteroidota bacterium]